MKVCKIPALIRLLLWLLGSDRCLQQFGGPTFHKFFKDKPLRRARSIILAWEACAAAVCQSQVFGTVSSAESMVLYCEALACVDICTCKCLTTLQKPLERWLEAK